MTYLLSVIILFLTFGEAYSGYCYYRTTYYYTKRVCVSHFIWCTHHRYVTRVEYRTAKRCCSGYKGNHCQEPICSPRCLYGTCVRPGVCRCDSRYQGSSCQQAVCYPRCVHGTCVRPGVCRCDSPYQGYRCQQVTCSYLVPCYPGTCAPPDRCTCQEGFTGRGGTSLCSKLSSSQTPDITQCTAFMANIERLKKRELYRFMADSSGPNSSEMDIKWVNQRDYNYVSVQFQAIYIPPEISIKPSYIGQTSLGIIGGEVDLLLAKVDRGGSSTPLVDLKNTTRCKTTTNQGNPETGVFTCNITQKDYDRVLEHGDNFTITVTTENGGFREIIDTYYRKSTNYFTGRSMNKKMMFRFDFYKPYNCVQNKSCTAQPLSVVSDITRHPISMMWDGWADDLSGVYWYTWEIYRLVPDKYTLNLTEDDPYHPEFRQEIYASNATFPTYTPQQSGMYSVVLQVADQANNTEYARTLALYDPDSEITIDSSPKSRLYVSSAENATDNLWQSNLDLPVMIQWDRHFVNKRHESGKLLNPVDPFPNLDYAHIVTKYVDQALDDKSGNRTLQGINNKRGIIKFSYAFRHSHQGESVPAAWTTVDGVVSQTQSINVIRTDGDSIIIWIRALDLVGNTKIDSTIVYFDSTPPVIETSQGNGPTLTRNINEKNSTFDFCSRVTLTTSDRQSGIHQIKWRILTNDTLEVLHEGTQPGNRTERKPSVTEGICNVQDECYYYKHTFDINNCWFIVPREKLRSQELILELSAFNMAMLSDVTEISVSNLISFNGIDEYSGPMNLRVIKVFDNGVKLGWNTAPTCYERSRITVLYKYGSAVSQTKIIDKDAETCDLVDLEPETNYTVEFVTEYGEQRSVPVRISFVTKERPGISAGFIAGISIISVVPVAMIIVVVFMCRTGRLCRTQGRIQRFVSMFRTARNNQQTAFNKATYRTNGDEEIYVDVELFKSPRWIVPHSQVTLGEKLTSGRFADIFKARLSCKENDRKDVIAKLLKSDYTEEDLLVMKAKVNFYAKEVGEHKNVLRFVGAVDDHDTSGMFMLLEYCERGPLQDWLLEQRGSVSVQIIEYLFRITFDIAKGMEYLANKKIVHQRLAARNILLTRQMDVKIAGFGPTQAPKEKEAPESKQKENDDIKVIKFTESLYLDKTFKPSETIPIRWLAPECMTSTKNATTESDVWSFGVVMWEIFSLGDNPYPGIENREVPDTVKSGYRMAKPEYASGPHFDLMKKCWQEKPNGRPTFTSISHGLGNSFQVGSSNEYHY